MEEVWGCLSGGSCPFKKIQGYSLAPNSLTGMLGAELLGSKAPDKRKLSGKQNCETWGALSLPHRFMHTSAGRDISFHFRALRAPLW